MSVLFSQLLSAAPKCPSDFSPFIYLCFCAVYWPPAQTEWQDTGQVVVYTLAPSEFYKREHGPSNYTPITRSLHSSSSSYMGSASSLALEPQSLINSLFEHCSLDINIGFKKKKKNVDCGQIPKTVEVWARRKVWKGGMKVYGRWRRAMEQGRKWRQKEVRYVCVCVCVYARATILCVKRLYSSLWSPKVRPAAAHGKRLDCVLPP